jgi:hypothetical protein
VNARTPAHIRERTHACTHSSTLDLSAVESDALLCPPSCGLSSCARRGCGGVVMSVVLALIRLEFMRDQGPLVSGPPHESESRGCSVILAMGPALVRSSHLSVPIARSLSSSLTPSRLSFPPRSLAPSLPPSLCLLPLQPNAAACGWPPDDFRTRVRAAGLNLGNADNARAPVQ